MTAIPQTVTAAVKVQYALNPGGPWVDLWGAADLGSLLRTRRFALSPGQGFGARYLRVVKVGAYDWGTAVFSIAELNVLEEQEAAPDAVDVVRVWNFNFDDAEQRYTLVATAGNVEVYKNGARQATCSLPYTAAQLTQVTRTQALDTLIAFHPDVIPFRIMRQGADVEWDTRQVIFDALPRYDYDGTKANAVDEIQTIYLQGFTSGDTWNITLDGETTSAIGYPPTAPAIKSALEALESVGADNVTVVSASGSDVWDVTFGGALAGLNMDQMAPAHLVSATGVASCATVQEGVAGGEDIVSAARGWPACGTFYQQRLWMGGLKNLPETLLGSAAGIYFNFKFGPALPNGTINETMDTDQVTSISALYPGQNLQIFTNSAEFYVPTEPITPPVAIKRTSRRGAAAGVPIFSITNQEGGDSTAFVGASRDALYEFTFTLINETYSAPNIAANAGHIVKGIVDLAGRRHRSTDECDLAFLVRDTGDAAVMVAMRDQDVTGFVPWTTNGQFLAAGCELNGDIYVVTARTQPTGRVRRVLEKLDPARVLDASVLVPAAGQVIAGLDHLEGMTVAAWIDGDDWGDFVVAGGQVDLLKPAVSGGEIGLNFVADGLTLPGVLQQDPRAGGDMHPRIGQAVFRLGPTSSLKAGVPGGRLYNVRLRKAATISGEGPGQNPFSGWAKLEGIPGFRDDAQLRFVQDRPGLLEIKEIVLTVST